MPASGMPLPETFHAHVFMATSTKFFEEPNFVRDYGRMGQFAPKILSIL